MDIGHRIGAVVGVALAAAANASLFVNGSLTGPTNTFSLVPPNWSNLAQGTTDTVSAAGHPFAAAGFANIGNFGYANSADGGTFAWSGDSAVVSAAQPEGLQQAVSGLTIGARYLIEFEYTNLGLYNPQGAIATNAFSAGQNYASSGRWLVEVAGVRVGETPAEAFAPTFGAQTWRGYSVEFTAFSSTVPVAFLADWTSGGTHVGMGIDGLRLTLVPAPAAALLLGAAGAVAGRRRRR